jgi:AcrR family transcriptional regulator
MTATAELGLRERKKAATRQALHEAALRLAMEHGGERVTVEAIADEAGVSRRTFSNYFASKEEALLHGDTERMRALIDKVHARPADESPWTALTNAAAEFYSDLGDLDPQWVARGRLVRTQPALAAAQVQAFAALERELEAEVAARMPEQERAGVRARLTAATFLAAMRVSLHLWLERAPDAPLWNLIDESLAEAGRGFR